MAERNEEERPVEKVDYMGNSQKGKTSKEEPKRELTKVVKGDVVQIKEPLGRRFKKVFFGGDAKSAALYVRDEVFLPALRNLVTDAISNGMDRLIYGESMHKRRRSSTPETRIQYNNPRYSNPIYTDPRERERSYSTPDSRPADRWRRKTRNMDNVRVHSREEAESICEELIGWVEQYRVVTLVELNDLLGLPSSYVDAKWGWTDLRNMEYRQVREGYLISFPPLEDLS
jgi:hypothetical protein